MKRLIALVLCVLMVFGTLPKTIAFAAAGDTGIVSTVNNTADSKTADPDTLHGWKAFFGPDFKSTENSGGVWSDKSVFETVSEFKTAQADGEDIRANADYNALSAENDNFIVALSGIAANKEITGYSAIPTDTVFILDLSQSMDNSGYVPSMVKAANDAIDKLMDLNLHNRVGVVLYSGNSNTNQKAHLGNATVILPLDRYTAGSNGAYLAYEGNSSDTTVKVANGVKNSSNKTLSGSKQTVGGTYIQAGLYLAAGEFKKAYEDGSTVIESGLIQGGTRRIPIITLMSDGRPTIASTEYSTFSSTQTTGKGNNRVTYYGVSNVGDGGSTNNTITFLTQLTAKWLKDNVADWYENDALFYTLWLKDAGDQSSNATLNPATSNETIDGWWKTFLNASSGTVSFGNNDNKFSVTRDSVIDRVAKVNPETEEYTKAWQAAQNYVDEAFDASNTTDFENAFKDIVNAIILQSQYYPTLVEEGDHDASGYVTIEDPVGAFMEVKEVEGILIGGHLFTGSALINMMLDNEFGNRDTYTSNGWELISAIQERIGVSESVAIALAQNAWKYGQLGYDSATGKYSNYIGWYADENNNYVGFWHEGHTSADVPANATQIMKSYGYYGVIDESISDSNIKGEDMMHIAVRISTQIDNGDQTVTFGIPASLIPLVNYIVEVNSDSLDTSTKATLTVSGATHPVRLVMEVGLRDGINELNVKEIVEAGDHYHTDGNGNYIFYTNRWGQHDNSDGVIEYPDPTASTAAVSHYNPSVSNERYYYTEDTIIYSDKNGTEYTGSAAPSGSGYYRIVYVFTGTGSGNNAQIVKNYVEITPEALAKAEKNADDNGWHIPQGTMRHDIVGFGFAKEENRTETLPYSVHVDVPGYSSGKYEVFELHGNNGRLILGQATGIELGKYIEVVIPGTSTEDFILNVAFDAPEGTVLPETVKVSYDGKTYTEEDINDVSVTLDANQKVYIYGLPAGVTYTVTEEEHDDYAPVSAEISGITEENKIVPVVFQNRAQEPGTVVISKAVEHPLGNNAAGLENIEFNFVARFETENGSYIANTDIETSKGVYTTNSSGEFEFTLKDGESISFTGLEKGTVVKVFEVGIPKGFVCTVSDPTITVENEKVKEFIYTNKYLPEKVKNVNIEIIGEKELLGREWLDTDEFEFTLMYWNGAQWEKVSGANDNTVNSSDKKFTLTDAIQSFTFDRAGAFNFWVIEEGGTIGGVTYDSTHRYFTVNVVNDWEIGGYKIESVTNIDERITYTEKDNVHILDMDFTNTYAPAGSDEAEIFIRKAINAPAGAADLDYSGFEFALFDDGGNEIGSEYATDGSGHAYIKLVYDASVLDTETNEDGEIIGYKDTEIVYTIREITPDASDAVPGMSYTTDYAILTVTLRDNLDGTISASHVVEPVEGTTDVAVDAGGTVVFTNDYEPDPTSATFTGEKTLTGRDMLPGEFVFELYETGADFNTETGTLIETAVNSVDSINAKHGSFGFETIHYDDDDIKTHYYVIKEQNAGKLINGVTYSADEYHITVKVTDNGGVLGTDITMTKNGEKAENIAFENSYETEKVTIAITKAWAGIELEERPTVDDIGSKIDFQLQYKTGNTGVLDWEEYTGAHMEVIDNGDDTWTVSYTMEFNKGEAVPEFRIVETKVPENYVTANNIAENGGTITNTYDVVIVSLSATKTWAKDNENLRPEISELGTTIDFELQYENSEGVWTKYAGDNVSESITDNGNGTWSIRYDVEFDSSAVIPNFRIIESIVPKDYAVSNGGVAVEGVITNTYDVYTKTIEATKAWAKDNEEVRPGTSEVGTAIDFELQYKNDANEWQKYDGAEPVVIENADGSWNVKFTVALRESEAEPEFRIVETKVPEDYVASNEGVAVNGIITNTYDLYEKEIEATKVWARDNKDVRPGTDELGTAIDFELQYKNDANEWKKYEGAEPVVVENADGSWKVKYTVTLKHSDGEKEFRIVESIIPENYVESDGGVAVNGTITNTYDLYEKTVEVTKAWANDNDEVRPEIAELGTAIDFELQYKDASGEWKEYTDAERTITENADGSWKVKYSMTLKHSEAEPEFRVVESIVPTDYITPEEGAHEGETIVNTYDVVENSVIATKVWANDNNTVRPEISELGSAIDFELQYKDDANEWQKYTGTNAVRSVSENADGTWTVRYDLEFDSTTVIPEFRIVETVVPNNYIASHEGVAVSGVITNAYDLYNKTIEATKVWANDNENVRPGTADLGTAVDFELQYKDAAGSWQKYDKAARNVAIEADGSWTVKYTVTLKHSESEPEFRIVEAKVPEDYVASNEGVAVNGIITNTYEKEETPPDDPSEPETYLTVRKEWNDDNNKEGARPAAVEVQIYANGRRYGSSFLLSEANRWTYTATRLPMYDANGELVEYTAVEVDVPRNYSVSYDTSFYKTVVITNTYGEEPGNPETGAPVMIYETAVPMQVFLPQKREDEE